jgi:hypothetical protein
MEDDRVVKYIKSIRKSAYKKRDVTYFVSNKIESPPNKSHKKRIKAEIKYLRSRKG